MSSHYDGTVTDTGGSRSAQIIVQAPGLWAYREGANTAITFDGTNFKTNSGQLTAGDVAVSESLLAHLPDCVSLQLAFGGSLRRIGSHFRNDDGKSKTYSGPYWTAAGNAQSGRAAPFPAFRTEDPVGGEGDFEIDGLLAGTYTLCVEKPESSMLNPCLCLDKAVNVTVAAGATVSSVSVVEPKGVILTVRGQDTNGLPVANPAADDLRIGTSHGRALFIPGLVTLRGATGRTMVVVVQAGLPAAILVSSAAFALADDKETYWGQA